MIADDPASLLSVLTTDYSVLVFVVGDLVAVCADIRDELSSLNTYLAAICAVPNGDHKALEALSTPAQSPGDVLAIIAELRERIAELPGPLIASTPLES